MENKEFANKVLYMRLKQQEYFRLAAEAKKNPSKHVQRKLLLTQSKEAEAEVDELIVKILNPEILSEDMLINAVSRCFLTKPAQLPPVHWNGYNYTLDVIYRTERFQEASEDLSKLINNYCAFLARTDKEMELKRKEQEA